MNLRFVIPPEAQARGGIANSVRGLAGALEATGRIAVETREGTARVVGEGVGDVDIFHFHGLWQPSHAALSRRLRQAGKPYVVSPHGMLEPWAWRHRRWKKRPWFHLVERRHLAGAASLFTTSELEKRNVLGRIQHPRIEVLALGCEDPHGPDFAAARAQLGWPVGERILLYLSRIDRKKGLDRLIEALAGLPAPDSRNDDRTWRLVIVGDGDPGFTAEVRALADRLENHLPPIDWIGGLWGERRWPYLQGADLFCLPTHSENFGVAVLESLHAGTPVLTTDQTPWADHGDVPGVMICAPQVDSIGTGLARAQATAENWTAADRRMLSEWATRRFSWSVLAEEYLAAYRRAAGHSPSLLPGS